MPVGWMHALRKQRERGSPKSSNKEYEYLIQQISFTVVMASFEEEEIFLYGKIFNDNIKG
jgi:hypothetical protein